jgi:hypothetical protein
MHEASNKRVEPITTNSKTIEKMQELICRKDLGMFWKGNETKMILPSTKSM